MREKSIALKVKVKVSINDDLSNLKLWLEGNKLSLNVSKTQAMLIGSRAKLQSISNGDDIRPKFVMDDEVAPMIKEAKYLGIQLDKTLSWKEHKRKDFKANFTYFLS